MSCKIFFMSIGTFAFRAFVTIPNTLRQPRMLHFIKSVLHIWYSRDYYYFVNIAKWAFISIK